MSDTNTQQLPEYVDPVDVLAAEFRLLRNGLVGGTLMVTDEDRGLARRLLTKVWARGWRIAEVAEEWEEDGLDIGVPDRGPHTCWRITREWEPRGVYDGTAETQYDDMTDDDLRRMHASEARGERGPVNPGLAEPVWGLEQP